MSETIRIRRQRQLLQKLSDALAIELEAHLVLWETIIKGKAIYQEDINVLKEHSYWKDNLDSISAMDIKHFRIVAFYFQSAFKMLERLHVRSFEPYKLETMRLTAKQAIQCFLIYGSTDGKDRALARAEILRLEHQLCSCDAMRQPENNQ